MQFHCAVESGSELILYRDVQEADLFELARPLEQADVDWPHVPAFDDRGDLPLCVFVVACDQDVERLPAAWPGLS